MLLISQKIFCSVIAWNTCYFVFISHLNYHLRAWFKKKKKRHSKMVDIFLCEFARNLCLIFGLWKQIIFLYLMFSIKYLLTSLYYPWKLYIEKCLLIHEWRLLMILISSWSDQSFCYYTKYMSIWNHHRM